MKHQLRTIIAAMLLLVTATGARASESLVETRQTGGHEVTVEATYSLRQEYSWDELFENVSTLNDINTCVTRTHPVVCLEMKLKGNYFLSQMKNKEAVSAVYVEWDNRWYKLGTITSYFAYYRDTPFSKIRTQFFRTHNYKSMANQWGYFFTTMFKNEQITSSCMPFYYVPSSTMIKQAAEGKCSTFRLKIENEPTTETVNNGDQYKVSYIINCSINYAKPKDITLRHASMTSLELQMGDQRLFDINDCRELNALKGLVRNEFKYSGLIDYPTKTNGFGNVDANSRHSLYYDLKKEGLYDFKLRSIPYEQLTIQIQDDARMVYEYGVHKYLGNEIECGYTVSWPRLNINTHIKLHASTPPFAYFDNSKVNIRWSPETDLRSYLIAYRAESPEDSNDAEANLEDADWKFLEKTFVGFGRSFEITDNKPIAYNKRYTYAFLQLPFTGSDNVDFTPYEKDTRKLEKGLIVCTTQVVVTPKMTVDIVQDKSVGDKISLNITPSKLPVKEAKQSYDVYRRAENETEWKKLETLSIANDGKTTATYTDKDVEGCNVYLYKVSTYAKNEDLNLDNLLESDSVRLSVLERSHVTKLDVSKGDRESSVMVNWEAKQIGSKTTTYLVQRRLVNTNDEFVTIHTAKGTANRYTYEDKSVDAGQFYDYRIEAYTEGCDAPSSRRLAPASASDDPDLTYSNSEGETGFCMSKGIISGRVSYGSGTSVEGVKIFLTPQEDDQEAKIVSHSQKLNNGGTIQWATTAKEMRQLASQKQPFTVQLYLHPEPGQTSQPIVSIPGLSPLRVTTNDSVATLALGSQTFTQELSSTQYNHITLTVDGTDVTLTLNGDTAHTETVTLPDNAWFDTAPDKDQVMLTLGGGQFHGYMREMRLWTRVLTPQETATTYDRTLSGLETGLAIYWPLDEGLVRHTFDISCTGGVKNKRHPYVDVNVRPDTWVPTSDQLSLYGITNKNGEYTIRSVSFTGTGTNYVIKPEKPLHEFQPATLSGFVSKQLLSLNNNDFKDMSSFEYRGTVRYLGTDIPVDSVTFQIDGQTVMLDNKPVMTDINGQYAISVPIGSHAIKATRNDHVLTRYPETGTLEFTEPGIINFTDSTLVNVAGRINGGADNDTIPLGFRLATCRIGVATMTLRLEREANNRFNLTEDRMPSGKQKAIPQNGLK